MKSITTDDIKRAMEAFNNEVPPRKKQLVLLLNTDLEKEMFEKHYPHFKIERIPKEKNRILGLLSPKYKATNQ